MEKKIIAATAWRVTLAAALLVFAQFAMAAQACAIAHAGCDLVAMSDDACMAQPDQTVASPDQPFGAMADLTYKVAPHFPLALARVSPRPREEMPLPAGPTLQVLFCSYQT